MNKYIEAYKKASLLTPKDFLITEVRKAEKLVIQACEKAEKYDEKETPKKTIKQNFGDIRYKHSCPTCEYCWVCNIPNYCPECGQKLDWSNEE